MPDPDRPDPEVIDFSPHPARTRLFIAIAAAAASIGAAAAVVFVVIKPGAPAAGHPSPALARLIAQVTHVPVRTSDAAGDGGYRVIAKPAAVAGPPLAAHGKPEVLYVATEYCPFCATQSWAMIVALSRFGTFSGLRTIRSAALNPALAQAMTDQFFPALDTWTFYGSAYTSRYLTFVPVETRSNVLVSRNASPLEKNSYTALQRLTPAQQAIFASTTTCGPFRSPTSGTGTRSPAPASTPPSWNTRPGARSRRSSRIPTASGAGPSSAPSTTSPPPSAS